MNTEVVGNSEKRFVRRADPSASVAHVIIDRPERRNAIDYETSRQLRKEFEDCEEDSNIRVIVLSGAESDRGRGIFSAGLDLHAFAATGDVGEDSQRGFGGLTRVPPSKPIIAAVEGYALAGGFEIALACDLIISGDDAKFGLPEVTKGLVADGGSLLRLPDRIPMALAMEFALTGKNIDASRMLSLGLVNHVVPPGEAVQKAYNLAETIALNAPLALRATKQILSFSDRSTSSGSTGDSAWKEQALVSEPVWVSNDAAEGAKAFAEKRPPDFMGS